MRATAACLAMEIKAARWRHGSLASPPGRADRRRLRRRSHGMEAFLQGAIIRTGPADECGVDGGPKLGLVSDPSSRIPWTKTFLQFRPNHSRRLANGDVAVFILIQSLILSVRYGSVFE
jgi:hypothetical protein